jgi:hypothetical protein
MVAQEILIDRNRLLNLFSEWTTTYSAFTYIHGK